MRLRGLAYKGTMRLAFEDALRRQGFEVPENVRGPVLRTATWRGPRD